MASSVITPVEASHRNLQRLFVLRNFEIVAIGLGIVIASYFFHTPLPVTPLLVILGLVVALNIYTRARLRSDHRISDRELFMQMLLDVAGLTAIFFFTGGASNPFVWFYLLPLMIAATILPRTHTWLMAATTILCYTSLFLFGEPVGDAHAHHGHGGDSGFQMHVLGMWLGFVMSAGFVAVIIVGMASSLRERDRRLAEAREQSLKNERLVALGTLATGAAHDLGTPLGTMAILSAELENDYADNPDLSRKLGILRQQVARCKETLSVISASAGAGRAESGRRVEVSGYIEEMLAEWRNLRPEIQLDATITAGPPGCELVAEQTLTQALVNILNNAADASPENVSFTAGWTDEQLAIDIADRGPGLPDDITGRLGKMPVSTKSGGLGVGLYLAHATIQRLGGDIIASNRDGGGTLLQLKLPLLHPNRGMTQP